MAEMNQQEMKNKCDGKCETCPYQWQMQCAARFGHRNNQNQKVLEERIDGLEEKLDTILKKISDVFGTEEVTSSPTINEEPTPTTTEVPTTAPIL